MIISIRKFQKIEKNRTERCERRHLHTPRFSFTQKQNQTKTFKLIYSINNMKQNQMLKLASNISETKKGMIKLAYNISETKEDSSIF